MKTQAQVGGRPRCGICRSAGVCLVALLSLTLLPEARPESPGWGELLAKVNMTPDKAQLAAGRWTGGGKHRLSMFQRLWDDWRLLDATTLDLGQKVLASGIEFEALVRVAAGPIDVQPPAQLGAPPAREGAQPAPPELVDAIRTLCAAGGAPLTDTQVAALTQALARVPESVCAAAASLLSACTAAERSRKRALGAFADGPAESTAYGCALGLAVNSRVNAGTRRLMAAFKSGEMIDAALVLARAMDTASRRLASVSASNFAFSWNTPLGAIILSGAQPDVHQTATALLILDTGGADQYRATGHPSRGRISLIVDLSGDDVYDSDEAGAFGTGILGCGLLLDRAGNDRYTVRRAGLGTGTFGVGVLVDEAGDDRYEGHCLVQGAACFGIGVLCDGAGTDEYRCFMQAQGYAGPKGCGILLDLHGDDHYEANDTDIRHPSPQTKKHNTSLAQGCGFGRRAHPGDGHSLAGGLGMLVDGTGNDTYLSGVFGQGVAYWYALGMLVDFAGDDSYQGVWYAQGSSAHYAVAALCDVDGDDQYRASMHQSQGHGRDYSTGLLHDRAGNDRYVCPGTALGSSNLNGVGLFWDEAGDDVYNTGAASLGFAGKSRPGHLSLGLFLDDGGTDLFHKHARAKPQSVWIQSVPVGKQRLAGVGLAR